MIKVKGHVGEIAACLHDSEPRIVDLARLVRATCQNRRVFSVHSLPPPSPCTSPRSFSPNSRSAAETPFTTSFRTLSCLSHCCGKLASAPHQHADGISQFDQAAFRKVVKYLLSFVNKDKHADALAEKLLHRLAGSASSSDECPGRRWETK